MLAATVDAGAVVAGALVAGALVAGAVVAGALVAGALVAGGVVVVAVAADEPESDEHPVHTTNKTAAVIDRARMPVTGLMRLETTPRQMPRPRPIPS